MFLFRFLYVSVFGFEEGAWIYASCVLLAKLTIVYNSSLTSTLHDNINTHSNSIDYTNKHSQLYVEHDGIDDFMIRAKKVGVVGFVGC